MQRQILIIDDHNDLANALDEVFSHTGHEVTVVENRQDAVKIENIDDFDVVITDLDVESFEAELSPNGNGVSHCLPTAIEVHEGNHIKAFKICAKGFRRDGFNEEELKN